MLERINEMVSVIAVYDRQKNTVVPYKVKWQGRNYIITKLGYYHKRKSGRYIQHVFDVTDGTMALRLICDSETLHWTLEEVSDGSPN